jgi:hypothetical protein
MHGVFLGVTFAAAVAAGPAASGFHEVSIATEFHVERPVLIARLGAGSDRHIVLAGRDDQHLQRLAVYPVAWPQPGPVEPVLALAPAPNLVAYDIGRLAGHDVLLFVEPGRILRYDFATSDFVELAKIHNMFGQDRSGEIVPIDFFRDINLDGRDDLVVPDTAGYRIRLQRPDGSLAAESVLAESIAMTVTGNTVSFESRPLFSGDMNFDGLSDLAVWRGDSLRIYEQQPDDRYAEQPRILELGLDLLSEAELRARQGGPGAVDQQGLTENRIWSIEDRNGDQLPDILIESALSNGVFDKRNEFRLHLGRRDDGRLAYREVADAVLASDGLQFGLVTTDIDSDGRQDLVLRNVRLTFPRVIRALLSGNVSLQVLFFRMSADGRYGPDADFATRTSVRFSVSTGHIEIPAIKVDDFDGDGLKDLMMQTGRDTLGFFPGIPKPGLFAEDSTDLQLVLPGNGDLVTTGDLNGDERADIIIRYNTADGDEAAHILRLLISD